MRWLRWQCALLILWGTTAALAQQGLSVTPAIHEAAGHASKEYISLQRITDMHYLPDGMELHDGQSAMRVTAVSEGVIRIQVSRSGEIPEHHSWAVLPSSLDPSLTVEHDQDAADIGFTFGAIHIGVQQSPVRLIVSDKSGHVITQNDTVRTVEFHGNAFRVYHSMLENEHFFGLGDKAGSFDRRESAFTLWNTDAYHWQESTDPLYKSIPFFLAMHGGISYGVFLDNTWRSSFDFGKEYRDAYSFGAEDGALDYYIITGDSPKQIVSRYTLLTGRPALPPLWAFGFQQSRWSYYPETRVREIATRLRADKIPADVLYLDIDYQDRFRPFTVDRKRFPSFEKMIDDLRAEKFHVIAITDLHIADAPGQGYLPFDAGVKGDHFIKNKDGSLHTGPVWPGAAVFPEFTQKRTRDWWGELYTEFYSKDGISGFWNDMNEPSVFQTASGTMPLDTPHRISEPGWPDRTVSHREVHNVFGMLNSRATYDGMLHLNPDRRPFVLTRATFAGGQRYAATWTGDNSSTWNHMRISTHQLLNLGLSGFAFAGDDIGGYAGSPPMDLLTRWLELGAFNPIYRDHTEQGTADQEPWVGGEPHESIRRKYIEERYRLMPYIYTVAEEASRTGIPMMRPLFLEFPEASPDNLPVTDGENQFLLGPDLLVAPAPFPETLDDYTVSFPENTEWFDYWTGTKVVPKQTNENSSARSTLRVHPPSLDMLPVFVRAGSILPRQPLVQSTEDVPHGALELRIYPGTRCEGSIYLDDGKSFAFRKGEFYRARYACSVTGNLLTVKLARAEGTFTPWWKEIKLVIYGLSAKASVVQVNGRVLLSSAVNFDARGKTMQIVVPTSPKEMIVTIKR